MKTLKEQLAQAYFVLEKAQAEWCRADLALAQAVSNERKAHIELVRIRHLINASEMGHMTNEELLNQGETA